MAQLVLEALDRPELAPLPISPRLKSQLIYFAGPASETEEGKYEFDPVEITKILDDGAIYLVSPLDTANKTEVELSEEQETLLQWLSDHDIRRARVRTE